MNYVLLFCLAYLFQAFVSILYLICMDYKIAITNSFYSNIKIIWYIINMPIYIVILLVILIFFSLYTLYLAVFSKDTSKDDENYTCN